MGMFMVAKYVLNPGDEAIIFDPVDFLFKKTVDAVGGNIKFAQLILKQEISILKCWFL
jgi:aspartate/methionine/tyrosine aminotransferase